jgi:predicted nucleic acid-binding protein
MKPLIVDTSIAVAIVRSEPEGPDAAAAIGHRTRGGGRIVVPSHFWLEATNTLIRRRRWPGADVLQAIHDLDDLGFETVEMERPLLILAMDTSERYGLTTYDATYLALAISLDGSLMTLDRALRTAAGARAVQVGPARLSETPAVYEHDVTWPNYKGASAFLAKLRAEAARAG